MLTIIGRLFLSLTTEALQGKMCQNSLPSGGGRSLGAKISGGGGRSWGILFGLYISRHINTALAMRALRRAVKTRTWANAQRDCRPVEHRWRPLFNEAKFG